LRLQLARKLLHVCVLIAAVGMAGPGEVRAQTDPWTILKEPGHAAFMRHSDAPGGAGDPAGFRLDDCATQRNLSEAGRAQARRTADQLKHNDVVFDRVLTSPWCRCRQTAELVTGKVAEDWDALSNLVGRQEHRASQVAALKAYLGQLDRRSRVLFVTHGIVIAALVGLNPTQGEMVVVRIGADGEPTVAARLRVD
jgi:broad specificity phosphatase PhoE